MSRLLLSTLVFFCCLAWAQPEVVVEGLFKGGAILRIDGQQTLLRQGQSSNSGVKVIEASTRHVVIEFDGQRQTLGLNKHISGAAAAPEAPEVQVIRDSRNRYLTYATINGRRITVLVDTGANIVAMSSAHAKRLGINYRQGVKSRVTTASGVAAAYSLVLSSVTVGGITVSGVEASVIEGNYPTEVLLGMSYLSQLDMQEQDGIMTLRRKY
ncbi:TIGR02281 family clan AA aspartic protease [Dasania sp. GY-MA-18]|uniref:TIGR02281 family clan AA aspartic protease n=1 Tax=Dasania phycosphaerae TaxID=2950436 RepID=A0A9J6RHV3_9GAMM|nr:MULTISPECIES: TIGR02281 family clan AA aspartic protease [Dasania]MCR8921518.1 TIGR02281 family clan AA aspartic protease [Dasania sp. GY-MA-18]MCZ0863946.1 TIGR02281 family clan AA aspartic protease [Dasania phycosphaerae]MCZ0867674.1 TIGR02281 family clan AA aspartic protease [Dasania phycosphaerae]